MTEDDPIGEYLAHEEARPFGNAVRTSRHYAAAGSSASFDGATNLLEKAQRNLVDGKEDRASALIDRALRLPFDEHEKVVPAVWAAHMHLFMTVTAAVEASDVDDETWLDAAIELLEDADPTRRSEMRDVLGVIASDYEITPSERRRIATAVASIPYGPAAKELRLPPDEMRSVIIAQLWLKVDYIVALTRMLNS